MKRWCAIAVFSDDEWTSFCGVIGNPSWTSDPRFATFPGRKEHEDEMERLVEEWTTDQLAEQVMTMMQAAGVAAGVVANAEDLLERDPHLKYRGFFHTLEHPEVGEYRTSRPAFMLSRKPCEVKRAPLLGEHNECALKEILGMSDEDIAQLVIDGAIE